MSVCLKRESECELRVFCYDFVDGKMGRSPKDDNSLWQVQQQLLLLPRGCCYCYFCKLS